MSSNLLKSPGARGVHLLFSVALLANCVIPPGLSEERTAASHRPVILRDTAVPIPVENGLGEMPHSGQPFDPSMQVQDLDISDFLYLRIFRDYEPALPVAQLVHRSFPPTETEIRTVTAHMENACPELIEGKQSDHTLLAIVSDKDFVDPGAVDGGFEGLDYQVTPGLTDQTFWRIRCFAVPPGSDGGTL